MMIDVAAIIKRISAQHPTADTAALLRLFLNELTTNADHIQSLLTAVIRKQRDTCQ